mmetsp:Transcript_2803/g.2878  ORF Transcript_2803/g.2878 Transcript_2803/m.2878 type:complete len:216 (+) Transcript_2803:12-659(+)
MVDQSIEYDHSFKIILVGDTSVGKTSILSRYIKGRFLETTTPTVGLEFCAKVVRLKDGNRIKALIWDTAGQEKYRSLVSQHYRKAFGALLVYDVTRKDTFVAVQRFLYDLRQWSEPDCVVYLVGNKVDLLESSEFTRAVPLEEVKQYAYENKLKYYETSAYSDFNINDSFYFLLEDVQEVKKNSIIKNDNTIGVTPVRVKANLNRKKEDKEECAC